MEGKMKIEARSTLEMYAEIVKLFGKQAETVKENTFYWDAYLEDTDSFYYCIALGEDEEGTFLELNDGWFNDENITRRETMIMVPNYDSIATILGHGVTHNIEIVYNTTTYGVKE